MFIFHSKNTDELVEVLKLCYKKGITGESIITPNSHHSFPISRIEECGFVDNYCAIEVVKEENKYYLNRYPQNYSKDNYGIYLIDEQQYDWCDYTSDNHIKSFKNCMKFIENI